MNWLEISLIILTIIIIFISLYFSGIFTTNTLTNTSTTTLLPKTYCSTSDCNPVQNVSGINLNDISVYTIDSISKQGISSSFTLSGTAILIGPSTSENVSGTIGLTISDIINRDDKGLFNYKYLSNIYTITEINSTKNFSLPGTYSNIQNNQLKIGDNINIVVICSSVGYVLKVNITSVMINIS